MCTLVELPGARSVAANFRVPASIDQPVDGVAIDQLIPVPVGNGSFTVTPFAVPVPAAPLLETVTTNPICEPASTGDASAVFVMERLGQFTVTVAVDVVVVPVIVAVLLTMPQATAVVVAPTVTL
jgi:hypothetical protein